MDGAFTKPLIDLASDGDKLVDAQHQAAQKLMDYDGETYPSDGCAITLSCLLQAAGIDVPDTYQALELGKLLESRNWTVVPVGQQQAGDVGSTCGDEHNHGSDHIYLVVKILNPDEMMIADNQAQQPHFRFASGKGKTPTTHFLRAPVPTPIPPGPTPWWQWLVDIFKFLFPKRLN